MIRTLAAAGLLAALIVTAGAPASAEEPKKTGTVDISSSSPDENLLKSLSGVAVVVRQKPWERLAADLDIKDVPKVDFSREILVIGTWKGTGFKFLPDVKGGDLTVELVGDKEPRPGFRYRIVSYSRDGITKFHGKSLPKE